MIEVFSWQIGVMVVITKPLTKTVSISNSKTKILKNFSQVPSLRNKTNNKLMVVLIETENIKKLIICTKIGIKEW